MILLLWACSSEPTSTVSTPEGCDGWTGATTDDQVLATPRPDPVAEKLAVCLTGDVVADEAVYDRVSRDLYSIWSVAPQLKTILPRLPGDGHRLSLDMTAGAVADADDDGRFACPAEHYDADFVDDGQDVVASLDGVYNLAAIAGDFLAIPGVRDATPEPVADGPRVTGGIDGDIYHYVFDDRGGDCTDGCDQGDASFWTTGPDGDTTPVDEVRWGPEDEPDDLPDWYRRWGGCQL